MIKKVCICAKDDNDFVKNNVQNLVKEFQPDCAHELNVMKIANSLFTFKKIPKSTPATTSTSITGIIFKKIYDDCIILASSTQLWIALKNIDVKGWTKQYNIISKEITESSNFVNFRGTIFRSNKQIHVKLDPESIKPKNYDLSIICFLRAIEN